MNVNLTRKTLIPLLEPRPNGMANGTGWQALIDVDTAVPGLQLSVVAGDGLYCSPRSNSPDPSAYTDWECALIHPICTVVPCRSLRETDRANQLGMTYVEYRTHCSNLSPEDREEEEELVREKLAGSYGNDDVAGYRTPEEINEWSNYMLTHLSYDFIIESAKSTPSKTRFRSGLEFYARIPDPKERDGYSVAKRTLTPPPEWVWWLKVEPRGKAEGQLWYEDNYHMQVIIVKTISGELNLCRVYLKDLYQPEFDVVSTIKEDNLKQWLQTWYGYGDHDPVEHRDVFIPNVSDAPPVFGIVLTPKEQEVFDLLRGLGVGITRKHFHKIRENGGLDIFLEYGEE